VNVTTGGDYTGYSTLSYSATGLSEPEANNNRTAIGEGKDTQVSLRDTATARLLLLQQVKNDKMC